MTANYCICVTHPYFSESKTGLYFSDPIIRLYDQNHAANIFVLLPPSQNYVFAMTGVAVSPLCDNAPLVFKPDISRLCISRSPVPALCLIVPCYPIRTFLIFHTPCYAFSIFCPFPAFSLVRKYLTMLFRRKWREGVVIVTAPLPYFLVLKPM